MKRFIIISICLLSISLMGNGQTTPQSGMHYFIDEHDLGAGNVQFTKVAAAHEKDLATQGKYNVKFLRFFVNEKAGKVYCLSQARDAHSIFMTHKEAHGLVPDHIMEVSKGEEASLLKGERQLFLDVHHFSPGSVTAKDVALAHQKDLEIEGKYRVNFINYWIDEQNGIVMCLSEAPDSNAIINTHREAHGLLPDAVMKVKEGK